MEKLEEICRSCKRVTNHVVLAQHEIDGEEFGGDLRWWETHQIIQCMGCNEISFRTVSTCTEDWDPETDRLIESVKLYPEIINARDPIEGYDRFPHKTIRIYLETLKAVNHQISLLAAIGLRVLIESICLEQKTETRDLKEGINKLADMGLLSDKQAEYLHSHRFMGNIAAHEIVAPNPQHLVAALDIAETLLKTIYILPDMAKQLPG